MATISTANFKNGIGIIYDGKMYTIVEFQHVKPGKGAAFVRTKLRDIKTGRINDVTFRSGEKFEDVRIETKEMQYLYNDGTSYYFMDNETFDQIAVPSEIIGDKNVWLLENDVCLIQYAGDELIGVEPPMFVELEIVETEPGFKGDTVQGGSKPATLETGAIVQVPLFVDQGEKVRVDTRDGHYVTRV
ncbi:MAG: elongation factor P [Coriobacteriia bacterium]|nr:elongation factor P [Coriobacteriia bacterium]